MDLFRVMMKTKNLTFVSNHYFRDLLISIEFYYYFQGVATFGGGVLWELYGI